MVAYPASYRLEIEGQDAGPLRSAEGGEPYGEVEFTYTGLHATVDKHIGAVHYADITVECAPSPGAPLMSWISAMLGGSAPAHAGAIVGRSSRLEFTNTAIREVEFPGLDAASRQSDASLTVRLAPESTARVAGTGQSTTYTTSQRFAPSDFRLRVDTLGSNVGQVDALVVRQTPAGLEVSDLVVTLPEDDHWYAWRDAFLGRFGPQYGAERTGTLEYLSHGGVTALARIDLTGLGIHSLVAESAGPRPGDRPRMRVSMYCESLRYSVFASPPTALPEKAGKEIVSLTGKVRSRVDVIAPLAERLEEPAAPS
jgi:hypothetical protein